MVVCPMMCSVAEEDPPSAERLWILGLVGVVVWVQPGVGILGIVAGVHLLKLRPWARTCLELLSWLEVAFFAGIALFWVFLWITVPPEEYRGVHAILPLFMGVLVAGLQAAPFVLIIRAVRSPKVRAAVGRMK